MRQLSQPIVASLYSPQAACLGDVETGRDTLNYINYKGILTCSKGDQSLDIVCNWYINLSPKGRTRIHRPIDCSVTKYMHVRTSSTDKTYFEFLFQ